CYVSLPPLSLHDALPIWGLPALVECPGKPFPQLAVVILALAFNLPTNDLASSRPYSFFRYLPTDCMPTMLLVRNISSESWSSKADRKSTRLNSSHVKIQY